MILNFQKILIKFIMNRSLITYFEFQTIVKIYYFFKIFLIYIIILPFVLPLLFLIKIIKPIIEVRFAMIRNDVIGHYIFDTEYYLSCREIYNTKSLDLFFFQNVNSNPNKQWTKMIKRKFIVSDFFRPFYYIAKNVKIFKNFSFILNSVSNRDPKNVLANTESHFQFTDDEKNEGNNFLKLLGIKNKKFICIMSRDSRYKKLTDKHNDMSYHDYRNSDILNYKKTINYFIEKGFFVFRMGKYVENKLNLNSNYFLDYANSEYRSDFLDIYLSANCKIFINGESGLCNAAIAFRKPLVMVNFSALEYIFNFYSSILTIPKKYYNFCDNKFITFKEIFEKGYGKYLKSKLYTQAKIKLIENTPEEILEATKEMLEIIENKSDKNNKQTNHQNKFWKLLPKSKLHGDLNGAIIGNSFLNKNLDLLN